MNLEHAPEDILREEEERRMLEEEAERSPSHDQDSNIQENEKEEA